MSTVDFDQINLNAQHGDGYTARDLVPQLAHEVRQPLSTLESISCYLDLIVPVTDTKAREQIDKMQELLQQTDWILSDAIHFLSASTLHPVLLDWNEILTGIVSGGDSTTGDDIVYSMDESIPPVLFDLDQANHLALGLYLFLRRLSHRVAPVQAMSKRLENSIMLEFSVRVPEGSAAVSEDWFRPFNTHVPAGCGLALASARQIVQSNGGVIQIESQPVGTIVCSVQLPMVTRSHADISAST